MNAGFRARPTDALRADVNSTTTAKLIPPTARLDWLPVAGPQQHSLIVAALSDLIATLQPLEGQHTVFWLITLPWFARGHPGRAHATTAAMGLSQQSTLMFTRIFRRLDLDRAYIDACILDVNAARLGSSG